MYNILHDGFYLSGKYMSNFFKKAKRKHIAEQTPARVTAETLPLLPRTEVNHTQRFFLTLATACMIADTPYLGFLVVAILSAVKYAFQEFGINSQGLSVAIIIPAVVLSLMSTIGDLTIANPVEFAKEQVSLDVSELDVQVNALGSFKASAVNTLAIFNKIIAGYSFLIGGAASALSIAYLFSQEWVHYLLGIPIALLGLAYYYVVYANTFKQHSYEFLKRLLSTEQSMIKNMLRSPAKSLEVTLQTVFNAFYRAVFFAYIMDQLLTTAFHRDENDHANLYYILSAGIITFYISLFTRTLNVHRKIFDPNFSKIPRELLDKTHVAKIGLAIDIIMTLLRAGSASTFIFRNVTEQYFINIITAIFAGMSLTGHGLYVRYNRRLHQTAFWNMPKPEVSINAVEAEADVRSADKIFNEIKELIKTELVKIFATTINSGGRIGRSIAFLGSLVSLNETLLKHGINLHLDFYDLICLHQLWGNTTFENEASFYQESVTDNIAYYLTKIHLERNKPKYGYISAFLKPVCDYDAEYLEEALTELNEKNRETQPEMRLAPA